MEDDAKQTSFRVLMFPWLAHGHVFPFLELARNLSKNNFHIYFLSTSINLDSVRKSLNTTKHSSSPDNNMSIELIELHLPSLPELPPHYHTTKNIPPHLMPTLMKAFQMSIPTFSIIISNLSPDLLIYDAFQPWAAKIASPKGIPAVHFATSGAATFSFFHHLHTHKNYDTFPYIKDIYLTEYQKRDLISLGESIKVEDTGEGFAFGMFQLSCEIVLIKSCRGVEGKYMDYLSKLCERKIVPVGPLVAASPSASENQESDFQEIMDWLDQKRQFSTLYISFGSENYLSDDQIREIARGLEISGVNFIWVVRSPDGGEIELPEGFSDEQRGLVVKGWAPQAAVLAHESVGGFMSHCGWSSVTESLYHAVPVVGVPLKLDQPVNCRVVVEAGVGVEVERDVEGGGFDGEAVARAVREVFGGEDGRGERMRCRAREVRERMRVEEGDALCEAAEELKIICRLKNNKPAVTAQVASSS